MKIKHATFTSFLILNFLQVSVLGQISKSNENQSIKLTEFYSSYNLYPQKEFDRFIGLIANEIKNLSNKNKLNQLQILSNVQLKTDRNFIAEGDVFIQNGSSVIIAEKFEYNYELKTISLTGKIKFNSKDQFFEASEFKYDLKNKTGFIKDVFGSINFTSLESIELVNKIDNKVNEDVFKDTKIKRVRLNNKSTIGFEEYNLKGGETFSEKVSSQKYILDFNDPQQWRFKTKRIDINENEWYAKKLFLTNDPFNKPQLVINNNEFKSINNDGEVTLKSKWSTIVLDDKLYIPTGPRRYKIDEDYLFRWGIGYDKDEKDGLYLTRNFDPKYFGEKENIILNLKKEFYLQRYLEGKTSSFSNKNESVLANKSERNSLFLDNFGLEGNLSTNFNNINLNSDFSINSLDLNKFKKSFRNKSEIYTILNSKDEANSKSEIKLSLFGNYRDKVWNGSLGEKEIISAYGLKINKSKNWTDDNVSKKSTIAASYGDYQAADRNDSLKMINRERLNIFLDRTHTYPIWKSKEDNYIYPENVYSPTIISSGLNINAQAKIDLFRYSDQNYQDLFIFKVGPELTLGNFKDKFLDYTKVSVYKKLTLANGNSPFGFDQSVDNKTIEFNIKQQIFGPITLECNTEYNLDSESPNYNKFFNTKFDLSWNRRAYSIGILYNNETKSGGINFKINSFNFDGYGDSF